MTNIRTSLSLSLSLSLTHVHTHTHTSTQSTDISAQHCDLLITILLTNHTLLKEIGSTFGSSHASLLLIGDADGKVLCKQRISDSHLFVGGQFSRKLSLQRPKTGDDIRVHFVSLEKVGTDVEEMFTPRYTTAPSISAVVGRKPQVCQHTLCRLLAP